jgi:hypothetical protein
MAAAGCGDCRWVAAASCDLCWVMPVDVDGGAVVCSGAWLPLAVEAAGACWAVSNASLCCWCL